MHRTTARAALCALAILATMGTLGACTKAEKGESTDTSQSQLENVNLIESDEPGRAGGKINYGLIAETDGWNPTNSRWAASGQEVAKAVYDTLVGYDENLDWQPNLAESLVPNDDSTVWVITLRAGVTFHNGSPVTGAAVAESMNLIKVSPLTSRPFEPVEKIEATGPLELTVTMKETWTNFPFALTTQIGVVADPEWLKTNDTRTPIGTGPFEFTSWEPGKQLTVTKNPDYWRDGYPLLDEVVFIPFPDEGTRGNAMQTGDIDIMQSTTGTQLAKFKKLASDGAGYQVVNDPEGETSEVMIMLNTKQPPLDDPVAREALAYATDSDAYIALQGDGQYQSAEGPFAPSSPWYADTDYPRYDLVKAKQLVEQVKAANGGTFSVTISNTPSPESTAGTALIQSQWAEAGVDVTIETVDQTQLIAAVVVGNYQATNWQQFDSPHPLGDSIWWHPNASAPLGEFALNFARNEDEAIGAELDAARKTTDKAEERAHYQEVMRLLAQDIPYIWLYHSQISIIAQDNLVNIVNYTLPDGVPGLELHGGSHPLWQIWLEPVAG